MSFVKVFERASISMIELLQMEQLLDPTFFKEEKQRIKQEECCNPLNGFDSENL